MRDKLVIVILLIISTCCYSQKVIQDTIKVNTDKTSIVTIEGEIAHLNLEGNVSLMDEPTFLNGKTIINLRADKKFFKTEELSIISKNENYYLLKINFSNDDFEPYFFIGSLAPTIGFKNVINKSKEIEEEVAEIEEDPNLVALYHSEAKRINSLLKRDFSKTKYVINGFKIELVNAYARNNKLFLRFEFENDTPYPFQVTENIFKITEETSFNKRSSPEQLIRPVYKYEEDYLFLEPKKKKYQTFVFDAFKINSGRMFKISVLEKNSAIEYFLPINAKFINQPRILTFDQKLIIENQKDEREKEN